MIVRRRLHLLRASACFIFFWCCLSHGYNGGIRAVKATIDLKPVNNWPGKFSSYSWMGIPITEILSMLSVDLLSSQGFSVSDGSSSGRGGCVRFRMCFELLQSPNCIQVRQRSSCLFYFETTVLEVLSAAIYFHTYSGSFQLWKVNAIIFVS